MSPERWMDLLKLYGPMALFVIMVFVLLVKARAKPGQSKQEKMVQLFAYIFVWISIFVLAVLIVIAYWNVNFPREYVVIGKITNLTYPQIVETQQELFLHKRTVAGLDFEYDWRLISNQRFLGTVELLLQQKPSDSIVLKYKLPIRMEFYQGLVEIEYDPSTNEMILKHEGSSNLVISPSSASIADKPPLRTPEPGVVFADSSPKTSPEELIRALDVDDPLIRRSARLDLAKLGLPAVPYLSQVLTNPKSSYRLRLGVLVALSDIGALSDQVLSQAARCSILMASTDSDPTMREEAKAVLARGITSPGNCPPAAPNPPQHGRDNWALLVPPLTFEKRGWHPIDMASATTAGIFALDTEGKVYSMTTSKSGLEINPLLSIPTGYDFGAVAANSSYIFVAANATAGCVLFRYSVATKSVDQKFIALTACSGIATYGDSIYVVVPHYKVIQFWRDWNVRTPRNFAIMEDERTTSLSLDASGEQLLMTDGFGRVYSFSLVPGGGGVISGGHFLRSVDGNGRAIVADGDHIFVASEKKVVVLDKSAITNRPSVLKPLRIKSVNGLTIDIEHRLWVADSALGIVEVYSQLNQQ